MLSLGISAVKLLQGRNFVSVRLCRETAAGKELRQRAPLTHAQRSHRSVQTRWSVVINFVYPLLHRTLPTHSHTWHTVTNHFNPLMTAYSFYISHEDAVLLMRHDATTYCELTDACKWLIYADELVIFWCLYDLRSQCSSKPE